MHAVVTGTDDGNPGELDADQTLAVCRYIDENALASALVLDIVDVGALKRPVGERGQMFPISGLAGKDQASMIGQVRLNLLSIPGNGIEL